MRARKLASLAALIVWGWNLVRLITLAQGHWAAVPLTIALAGIVGLPAGCILFGAFAWLNDEERWFWRKDSELPTVQRGGR